MGAGRGSYPLRALGVFRKAFSIAAVPGMVAMANEMPVPSVCEASRALSGSGDKGQGSEKQGHGQRAAGPFRRKERTHGESGD